ncbi:hypothetical protein PIB30_076487 [Stylosanthes scabra]|uniref:Uncharacterized protein n=1 Tax=Stylosanthes scabra TaxID=79078 RepID=A0ABU6SRT6_9FABA|nr:hypothetical protein [Stylosanthes scabra]
MLVEMNKPVLVVLVYGSNALMERSEAWKELMEVKTRFNNPIIAFGGFNEFLDPEDRSSGKIQKIPKLKVKPLKCSKLDHVLLVLKQETIDWGRRSFRSLDVWFSHNQFKRMFNQEWRNIESRTVAEKMRNMKNLIRTWRKEKFGNIDFKRKIFKDEININGVNGRKCSKERGIEATCGGIVQK